MKVCKTQKKKAAQHSRESNVPATPTTEASCRASPARHAERTSSWSKQAHCQFVLMTPILVDSVYGTKVALRIPSNLLLSTKAPHRCKTLPTLLLHCPCCRNGRLPHACQEQWQNLTNLCTPHPDRPTRHQPFLCHLRFGSLQSELRFRLRQSQRRSHRGRPLPRRPLAAGPGKERKAGVDTARCFRRCNSF